MNFFHSQPFLKKNWNILLYLTICVLQHGDGDLQHFQFLPDVHQLQLGQLHPQALDHDQRSMWQPRSTRLPVGHLCASAWLRPCRAPSPSRRRRVWLSWSQHLCAGASSRTWALASCPVGWSLGVVLRRTLNSNILSIQFVYFFSEIMREFKTSIYFSWFFIIFFYS